MNRGPYPTREAARRALLNAGYWPLHVPLDTQTQPWARTGEGDRMAIGVDQDTGEWHIVEYVVATRRDEWLD